MIGQMRQSIFNDSNLTLFQQAINDQFIEISKIPFINGRLIEGLVITSSGVNQIEHKLGRQAKGYFVTSNGANSVIWNGPMGDTYIPIYCSANTTVSLWVF